jgi:hypothetical protein
MSTPKISVYINHNTPNCNIGECIMNAVGNIPNKYFNSINIFNSVNDVNFLELCANYKKQLGDSFNAYHEFEGRNDSNSYNFMLSKSRSELSLFLEPNITISSKVVESMMNTLFNSKGVSVGMVGARIFDYFDNSRELMGARKLFDHHGLWLTEAVASNSSGVQIPSPQCVMMLTSILERKSGFDTSFKNNKFIEDFALNLIADKFVNYTVNAKAIEHTIKAKVPIIEDNKTFHTKWIDPGPWPYAIPD